MGKGAKGKWSGRFDGPVDELMAEFNASIGFDVRLLREELAASAAHARMLGKQGIVSGEDSESILAGLARLSEKADGGDFRWTLDDEDIHTAVERRLVEDIGDAGKRLHTARSRNDQVATVTRLWLRGRIDAQLKLAAKLRAALLGQAKKHLGTVMPGFTHLQVAQPTTLAHHLHAHSCMLARDRDRLRDCRARVNVLPLGAAALAGTGFDIDPEQVAAELGFDGLCRNSMDAVSDRDFAVEYLAAASLLMVHLSRLGEEVVLWCSQPFGFARVPDGFSTGSSIMPQKRNPDAAELVRGKSGRVFGRLVALLTALKGQPLAYNKDSQEDKEALFDAADTVESCLAVFAPMVEGMTFDAEALSSALERGCATATDLADLMVREGMPFREAHEKVARAVNAAEQAGVPLSGLPDGELAEITGLDAAAARGALDPAAAVGSRRSPGGPSPEALEAVIDADLEEAGREG